MSVKLSPREGGATFSLENRLLRLFWKITWNLLAKWTPVPFFKWRRAVLASFGADIHPTARIYPGVEVWLPSNLSMGPYSCLAAGVICYSMDKIVLGEYALVSQRAHLCAGSHDIDSPAFELFAKPITIDAHAWIAAEGFVGPGVTVGEGAVLGARGVAFKDLQAWTVYVGVPARQVRARSRKGNSLPQA